MQAARPSFRRPALSARDVACAPAASAPDGLAPAFAQAQYGHKGAPARAGSRLLRGRSAHCSRARWAVAPSARAGLHATWTDVGRARGTLRPEYFPAVTGLLDLDSSQADSR